MRKKSGVLAVLLAVLCLALAACGSSGTGGNFMGFIQDWGPAPQGGSTSQVKSEIVPYDTPAFGESLGFDVTDWPDTAELAVAGCYAVDGWFGQIEYHTPDGRILVVRGARAEDAALAAIYRESHGMGPVTEVGDVPVRRGFGEDGCVLFSWERGGFQFTAHSGRAFNTPSDDEVAALVNGLAAREV